MNRQIVKIFSVMLVGGFSSSLSATDVSSFDIKGIRLGMDKGEVLKRIPCSNYEKKYYRFRNAKNEVYSSQYYCGKPGTGTDNSFLVNFDHNNYVFSITKRITFDIQPNLSKIKSKLIKRYGKPNTDKRAWSKGSYYRYEYCWGDCSLSSNRRKLSVDYSYYSDYNNIDITLYDYARQKNNDDWTAQRQKILIYKKEKEVSNIDF